MHRHNAVVHAEGLHSCKRCAPHLCTRSRGTEAPSSIDGSTSSIDTRWAPAECPSSAMLS